MTGNQLKFEIKKLNITQEEAAKTLGITRQTLGVWFKYAEIDEMTKRLVSAKLGIKDTVEPVTAEVAGRSIEELIELNKSQQRIIEMQAETIKNLTTK